MSHATRMNEARNLQKGTEGIQIDICERVMSHTCMHHFTHMNASRHMQTKKVAGETKEGQTAQEIADAKDARLGVWCVCVCVCVWCVWCVCMCVCLCGELLHSLHSNTQTQTYMEFVCGACVFVCARCVCMCVCLCGELLHIPHTQSVFVCA